MAIPLMPILYLSCELINERFPRARWHDGEGVIFLEETRDRVFLSRAEGVEAEVGEEGGGEGHLRSISLPVVSRILDVRIIRP